ALPRIRRRRPRLLLLRRHRRRRRALRRDHRRPRLLLRRLLRRGAHRDLRRSIGRQPLALTRWASAASFTPRCWHPQACLFSGHGWTASAETILQILAEKVVG